MKGPSGNRSANVKSEASSKATKISQQTSGQPEVEYFSMNSLLAAT